MTRYEETRQKAIEVLFNNIVEVTVSGITYRRTVPSKEFYVHQWNWDSACVAMGLMHVDPDLAFDELNALLAGQWKNGMVPHIIFNPDEKTYFPGPDIWQTHAQTESDIVTSGITQPPVLTIALHYLYKNAPTPAFAQKCIDQLLPKVIRFHEYLKHFRDPEDGGLISIIHSWESGVDNSPCWDEAYQRINIDDIPQRIKDMVHYYRTDIKHADVSHRPKFEDYYRYLYLVDLFKRLNWDSERIMKESPFCVKDILFSSIWAQANQSLAELCGAIGKEEERDRYHTWAEQTRTALQNNWSDEYQQYCEIDVAQGRHEVIHEPTISMFFPLYAHATTEEQLPKLLARLTDPQEFWTPYPVPSTALNSPKFDIARYWRGPSWVIINAFIIQGLKKYKDKNSQVDQLAEHIIDTTLAMIADQGFSEYFDPTKGGGFKKGQDTMTYGFGSFSWTAAFFIMLYDMYRR